MDKPPAGSRLLSQGMAAWIFYTRIPLPLPLTPTFDGIARWLPLVGLGLGCILVAWHWLLSWLVPDGVRGILVTVAWLIVTGGLHLDGVADVADGLSINGHDLNEHDLNEHDLNEHDLNEHDLAQSQENGSNSEGSLSPGLQRRLEVMSDSRTGAYGVMALCILLIWKSTAVASLPAQDGILLVLTPAWGRMGQLLAIGLYPYLKPTGSGHFLKASIQWPQDGIFGMLPLVLTTAAIGFWADWTFLLLWSLGSGLIAAGVGYYFDRALGGHTGDTYGATVEWVEVLCLTLGLGLQSFLL
ncbi:MAG: adenosylcobinamide-GDP ribazoletransferase [Synechococcaceae cyanobacterium SM2_3_2]|nr:adenosylcobinamide-GDP ribazoletransferase [Synechococcaceae cyanobacterium SM2_3_2]